MKRKVMILGFALAAFTACQQHDEIGLNPGVTEINPSDLPSSSQSYMDTNFSGEVVANAYRVTATNNEVTYEAFMTNNTNLVFHEKSELMGFGNINSRMEMVGEMFEGGMQNMGMFGKGSMLGNGSGGMMSRGDNDSHEGMMGNSYHEFRNHPEAMPEELNMNELPSDVVSYLNKNYPDMDVLMAFAIEMDDKIVEYQVLVQEIGGMIFDKDGKFKDMIRRGKGHCEDYEKMDIDELPDIIVEYIESHYPEAKILGIKMGSKDNYKEIQVMMEDIGIVIFDTEGKMIKLVERRRPHQG